MSKNQLAVIGLATMGSNFAKNFASRSIKVAVFNRSYSKTQELTSQNVPNIEGFESLHDCIKSLDMPRKVFLLVKAGSPTDQAIEQITELLDEGDIIVECGNSNWKDTIRRQETSKSKGINFIGCGISGGSEGALLGPSLMPSGYKYSVDALLPFLEEVAAKDFDGRPCVTNVGSSCSGHFVKMVHNGIEYAMMQGIAEVYHILLEFGYSQEQMLTIFEKINQGETSSFLTDITCQILSTKDKITPDYLLPKLDYRAGSKGTGKWTIEAGMDLGVAVPNIYAGLNARVMSELNFEMKDVARVNNQPHGFQIPEPIVMATLLQKVLSGIYLISYTQGLELIYKANEEYKWNVEIQEVLRIWQGGCIIRSQMLLSINNYYKQGQYPAKAINNARDSILELYGVLSKFGIHVPFPEINATKDYIYSMESGNLPQNLTQAQRDLFGAHTYKRVDRDGVYSGGWN